MKILATLALLLLAGQEEAPDAARARVALEHYAMWNGGFPKSLEDLVKKPAGAAVWPEGGFLDKAPKLDYGDGKLAGEALVLRTENVKGVDPKILTTRYRLAQLAAA